MSSATQTAATLDDLYRVEGKAELIGGGIVPLMAAGRLPNRVASRIARSLDDHAEATGIGEAYTDNIGFAVPILSSGRESFSPDASYFLGPFPANAMRFLEGAPTLAVEVRSECDYGQAAEVEIAAKRADYFEAGTAVVWDWTPSAVESSSIAPRPPIIPTCSSPVRRPTRNRRCSAGGWLWIGSSPDHDGRAGRRRLQNPSAASTFSTGVSALMLVWSTISGRSPIATMRRRPAS